MIEMRILGENHYYVLVSCHSIL